MPVTAIHAKAAVSDLYLFGPIEPGAAKPFAQALAEAKGRTFVVHINSPGGDLFEGLAMHAALQAHGGETVCRIEGLCASAASVVAMAGKTVTMASGSELMIHLPSTVAAGDAGDLRQAADQLDHHAKTMAGIYATRTGKPVNEILAALDKETWFTAEEALKWGLIDAVTPSAASVASFDLTAFQSPPDRLKVAASANPEALRKENVELKTKLAAHREKEVKAIVDAAVKERRIVAGETDSWVKLIIANPDAEAMLAALPITRPRYGAEPVPILPPSAHLSPVESDYADYKAKLAKHHNLK